MNLWAFTETGWTMGLAVAVAAALLAFCVVLERRRGRRGMVFRLLVSAVAVVSLLFLFLRPLRSASTEPVSAVLLTPGAESEPLELADGEKGFVLGVDPASTDGAAAGSSWPSIPDLAFLSRRHPGVDRLRVLGHGPPPWEWDMFPGVVEVGPSQPVLPGIREIAWSRQLTLGGDLVVRGLLTGVGERQGSLRLEGPGGPEDRHDLSGADEQSFELRARPRATGHLLYKWVLETEAGDESPEEIIDAEEVIDVEGAVDVVVEPPAALAVLWIEDAPSFETRHFKHWLTEQGGRLAVRSRISRDRFRTEVHGFATDTAQNLAGPDLERLRPEVLDRFDLVVIDPPALAALAASEAKALQSALTEGGLGLLALVGSDRPYPDDALQSENGWPRFQLEAVADLEEMSVAAAWPGAPPSTPLVIAAREIAAARGADPLVLDDAGRWLAASHRLGRGRVGITLLGGSYRWVLEGHPEHHGGYWNRLIKALARRVEMPTLWRVPPGPIFVDEPLELVLETRETPASIAPASIITSDSEAEEPLTLRRDALERGRWRTLFWPRRPGWHRLSPVDGGRASWFHVEDPQHWTAWRQARRQTATRHRALENGATVPPWSPGERPPGERSPAEWPLAEWPRLWPFLTFLVAVVILWADERGVWRP